MARYRVVFHEGALVDTDLETYLNGQSALGWEFAGSISASDEKGVLKALVVFRQG